jgi:hypothetical protein
MSLPEGFIEFLLAAKGSTYAAGVSASASGLVPGPGSSNIGREPFCIKTSTLARISSPGKK